MEVLKIPNLDLSTLEFIYEIRKQIEMRLALSKELLGIGREYPTAIEVKLRME